MRLLAPAKINLHLRVGPLAADGFHPLLSWFTTIGLFDILTIDPSEVPDIRLTCDDRSIPMDERNLIVRAANILRRMRSSAGREAVPPPGPLGLEIQLNKRIPAGGGLGGGSSDAARTILAVNRLWELNLPPEELIEVAAAIGSDVPFFLSGGSCICTGRGEVVNPIPAPAPKAALLILPPIAISTAAVYQEFDRMGLGSAPDVRHEPDWSAWARLHAAALLPKLVNDLEPAAFSLDASLRKLREEMEHELGRIVRMSGSGSTLFTLFDETSDALKAHERLLQRSVKTMIAPIAAEYEDDLGGSA